jgi:hypothetical protein
MITPKKISKNQLQYALQYARYAHNPQLRFEDFAAESSLPLIRALSPMFFGSKLLNEQ